ncbi:MAG TPA: hypothetical protein VGJ01_00720 [Pseudolabrys sp.]|jgi:hypothetical protein
MTDWRSFIIVLALFGVLLSALATERFRPCAEDDRACRDRAPWYTFPIARTLSQMQGPSSVRIKSRPGAVTDASPLP